jgi:hypothetical protein
MTLSVRVLRRLLIFSCMIGSVTWRCQGGEADSELRGRKLFGWAYSPADHGPRYPIFHILMVCKCGMRNAKRARMRSMRRGHRNRRISHSCLCMLLPLKCQINARAEIAQLKAIMTTANAFGCSVGHVCKEFLGDGVYLALLLLLAADVEVNPGPDTDAIIQAMNSRFDKSDKAMEDINNTITGLKSSVDGRFTELIKANEILNNKVVELEKRLSLQESDQRRKNIIVFGAPSEPNVYSYLQSLFSEKLRIDTSVMDSIEKAFRIGRQEGKRPILIKFFSERHKIEVMRQAHFLKGTRIRLSDDLTPDERKQRNVVVMAQKEAKNLGITAKVRHNGLLIGKELVAIKALTRPGWAEKYTNPRRRKATNDSDESEGAVDNSNDNQSKRQKANTPQSEDSVFTEDNSVQGFRPVPGGSQTVVTRQNSKENANPRKHSSRSLERKEKSGKKAGT